MTFGINTFLFTSPFTNDSVHLFPLFKTWGFDTVEIALEDASHINPEFIKTKLEEHGLQCKTVCAVMGSDRDLRGTPEEQETAKNYLKSAMDLMVILGATTLVGPLYSAVGRADAVEEEDYKKQWQTVVGHLKELADYAEQRNLKLAIEPLNRFETDFINTVDQSLQLIRDIGSPVVLLHYDTFHMNIEEKDQAKAILRAGSHFGHLHACGSDRGTPGKDHTDWVGIAKALKSINYQGEVVIESFTKEVKVIARAAAIWRKIESSQEVIASEGVKFLRSVLT
ncbi:MAG: sugar phosphate isomerase/epimerase family protein [Saprospiraceae bacterium]|nr:sugar phosphate isomerase/epimerase family protein [Saprospiraceae bacterium]